MLGFHEDGHVVQHRSRWDHVNRRSSVTRPVPLSKSRFDSRTLADYLQSRPRLANSNSVAEGAISLYLVGQQVHSAECTLGWNGHAEAVHG